MKNRKAFFESIQAGQNEQARELLDQYPELIECKTGQGVSVVMLAAYYRNKELLKLFKERKNELDIFEASALGDLPRVKELLKKNPALLDAYSPDGFTPLGLAAFFSQALVARFLVENGAQIDKAANNDFKVTPLHSATSARNVEIARLLLTKGAQVNACQQLGVTPLHSAAHNGQIAMIELLLEYGAGVNAEMQGGRTPLDMALEKEFTQAAELLRAHGAGQ